MKALNIDVLAPFQKVFEKIINSLPTVAGFFGYILVAWLVTKILLWIVKKILIKSNVDRWSKKLSETKIFGDTTINIVLTNVILGVLKWFLIILFVMAGSSMFGFDTLSNGIQSFIAYLPRLLTSLIIFVGGAYIGTVIKNAISSMFKSLDINGGNLVGNIVFYLIVVFLSITALDHAGVDTSIIKSNVILIIGSILLAFTIAFGFGAREAISRLLYGYYSRKNIGIGEKIKVDGIEGTVIAIDNICLTLATDKGKAIIPIKDIVDHKIEIKK